MQAGKAIAAKRLKPESDSERERVRKLYRKKKIAQVFLVLMFFGGLVFLSVRAVQECARWLSERGEETVVVREPKAEIIDEMSGQITSEISSRMKELVLQLEDEFEATGYKLIRVRIPADKARELDLELEGVTGVIKVSMDRNAAVSAEDTIRMLEYLEKQGIGEFSYIDVRIERKGYWK